MKNGTETRPNGVIIKKSKYGTYHVLGSANGPWDYLSNARKDADSLSPTPQSTSVPNERAHTR